MWQTKIKLENTEYHRANLCCDQKEGSDTECTEEASQAIILAMTDPNQQVHMIITNVSSYYPVMPQYAVDSKGNEEKGMLDKGREGYVGNGQKNEGEFSDGLLQINQCNNKVMTAQVCFSSVDNTPIFMKKARLRIFDIDMGSDPNRLGPEAVQFSCPGGHFEVYGDTPPYVSWVAGHPISVQPAATRNGLTRTIYKCPDEVVTVWARMNGRMDAYAGHDFAKHDQEIELEERMIMVEFADFQCANLTFASMPPRYRVLEGPWKIGKDSENGGNPLNGTRKLAYKNFNDLVDGPCHKDGGGRNTLVAGDWDEHDVVQCYHPPPAPPSEPGIPLEVVGSTTDTGDAAHKNDPPADLESGPRDPGFSDIDGGYGTHGTQVCTDIDFQDAELTVSNLGGTSYCCEVCPQNAQKLCCPAPKGEQEVPYDYQEMKEYLSTNLCAAHVKPDKDGDTSYMRITGIQTTADAAPLNIILKNITEYAPSWPRLGKAPRASIRTTAGSSHRKAS